MIYLDTNVVVWLSGGHFKLIPNAAICLIQSNESLLISPMVQLELQYLFEIKRIIKKSDEIISMLQDAIGLKICEQNFLAIIQSAKKFHWTRDPFDRLITATAAVSNATLITSDKNIAKHYEKVVWNGI